MLTWSDLYPASEYDTSGMPRQIPPQLLSPELPDKKTAMAIVTAIAALVALRFLWERAK